MPAEDLYKDLDRLYSNKGIENYRADEGLKIRKIVNLIIREIVNPLSQKLNVAVANNTFDGEIIIDDVHTFLYEIDVDNLSSREYERLVDMTRAIGHQGKTCLLIVTREISDTDRRIVDSLKERVDPVKMTMVFIEYKSLISLHRFCSGIQIDHAVEELRIFKKLFLENLLKSNAIMSQELFESAWYLALDGFYRELQSPYRGQRSTHPRISQQRLQRLERMLHDMLNEVRELRKEIRSEIAEARISGKMTKTSKPPATAPYIIDLREIEGDGEFTCPVCTSTINPDDETEESYRIIEARKADEELDEMTIQCRMCNCIIKLVGFREPSFSEEE